jgi:misacylated tRNA(Ala) deacylase
MTELLYLPDNEYQKDFGAEVTKAKEADDYIVLDRTLFYPEGGGQPHDTGEINWDEGHAQVVKVKKSHGEVRHYLEGDIPEPGTEVHGTINWPRRYKHMRMHTAQHVVSRVVLEMYGATTAGNQIHEDRSRIDFKPVEFTEDDIEKIEKAANSLIAEEHEVKKKYEDRETVESMVEEGRSNMSLIPDHVDPMRIVEFGDDICPCGGTHVDSIDEIGMINIINRVSKGADTERIEFELEQS